MSSNGHAEMLIVLAKNMPLQEITTALVKNGEMVNSMIKDGKIKPTFDELVKYKPFTDLLTFTQLFITKMAYDGKETVQALKDIKEFSKDYEMKNKTDELRNKGSN